MSLRAPYAPHVWSLGGTPKASIDVPVTSICLVFYICGAATHMAIFQMNKKRGHKFVFNVALFGFCMSRVITCSLRISTIIYSHNVRLAIAAQIFTAAGVIAVFIINLLWTQRLVRSLHPCFGWHRIPSTLFKVLWPIIVLTLAVIITATVQSFYTLRPRTHSIDRALQLYGTTFLAVIAFLPLPILSIAFVVSRRQPHDAFGTGALRTNVAILLMGTVLLCLGASYRAGTMWLTPVPKSEPLPGYYHKAAFYIFNFGVEIFTVYLYAVTRVDRRFHIPDGARGPGSYSQSHTSGEHKEVEELA